MVTGSPQWVTGSPPSSNQQKRNFHMGTGSPQWVTGYHCTRSPKTRKFVFLNHFQPDFSTRFNPKQNQNIITSILDQVTTNNNIPDRTELIYAIKIPIRTNLSFYLKNVNFSNQPKSTKRVTKHLGITSLDLTTKFVSTFVRENIGSNDSLVFNLKPSNL